jgi:hypothetical protein
MLMAMFIVGVLWVIVAFTVDTNGLIDKLMLKAFPFFSGCFVAIYAAAQLGWISLGV